MKLQNLEIYLDLEWFHADSFDKYRQWNPCFDLGLQRTTSEHTPHTVGVTSPPFGAGWPESTNDAAAPQGSKFYTEQYPSISNIIIYQHHMAYVSQIYLLQQSNGPLAVLWVFPPTMVGSWWFIFLSEFSCHPPTVGALDFDPWKKASTIPSRCAISVPSSSPIILARRIWTTLGLWCISISSDVRHWRKKITSHHIPLLFFKDTPIWAPIMNKIVMDFPAGAIYQRFSWRSFWGCNPVWTNPREIIKFPHSYLIVYWI